MTRILSFIYEGKAAPKPRMTKSDKWRDPPRPSVAAWYVFKDLLTITANQNGYQGERILALDVDFFISTRKASRHGEAHRLRPDLSNLVKAVEDALTEHDESISTETTSKTWTSDRDWARIRLVLDPLDKPTGGV